MRFSLYAASVAGAVVAMSGSARAESIFAILNNDPSVGQTLVTFDSNTRAVTSTVLLQGPNTLSPLSSIDVRPATGELFGYFAGARQLFKINPGTGSLTAVGSPLAATPASGESIDFNPTVDRIRLVGTNDSNLRLDPTTGAIAATDTDLAFAAGDSNAGDNPNIRAIAYTNSISGASSTTLYGVDVDNDVLVTQNPPNNGTLNTTGPLGVDLNAGGFGTFTGFDISGATGTAYLTDGAFAGPSNFYSVNLATGAATSLGTITGLPAGRTIAGIAVAPVPEPAMLGTTLLALIGVRARRRVIR